MYSLSLTSDTEIIDTIKQLSVIVKAAVYEDNEESRDDFSREEVSHVLASVSHDTSIDDIPEINGISIADLNIENELGRRSSYASQSSLSQTSLARCVRWRVSLW